MDAGILSVTPAATPAAPPPPAPAGGDGDSASVEVGGNSSEDALLDQALATLRGEGDEAPETAEGEAPAEGAPAAAEPAEKPAEVTQAKLSKGFAKLRAQEERFERRAAEMEAAHAQREATYAERDTKYAGYEQALQEARQSPLRALKLLGWEYDQLAKYVLNDGQLPPEQMAKHLQEHQQSEFQRLQGEIESLKQERAKEGEARAAREFEGRVEGDVHALFKGDSPDGAKYPHFAHHFRNGQGEKLMVDVKSVLAKHFNQTCVRDEKGRIIKPGEIVASERAVMYIENILKGMQVGPLPTGNPGQSGAVKSANTGAAKPRPLVARDASEMSVPSDQEIESMSDEERFNLALQVTSG